MRRTTLLLILLLAPVAALADYKESYKEGIKAIDRKNWDEAARHMRAAAAERITSGEKILIYGMRLEPYVPEYFLGLALFNSGDCDGAIEAFNSSEAHGAIKQSQYSKNLQKLRAECEKRGAGKPPQVEAPVVKQEPVVPEPTIPTIDPAAVAKAEQRAKTEIQSAEKALAAVGKMKGQAAMREVWASNAPLRSREADATRRLAAARTRLAAGSSRSDVVEINGASEDAIAARLALDELRLEAQSLARKIPGAVIETPSVTPQGPPAVLLDAARAYFRGEYNKTLSMLERFESTDARAKAYSLFFQGASRFALYVANGKKDARLKQRAIEDLRGSRKLDPRIAVSTQAFSPRFAEFFSATK